MKKRKRIKISSTDLSGRKNIIVVAITNASAGDEEIRVFKETLEGNYEKIQRFTDSCIKEKRERIPAVSDDYEQTIENMKEQNNLLESLLEQRIKKRRLEEGAE